MKLVRTTVAQGAMPQAPVTIAGPRDDPLWEQILDLFGGWAGEHNDEDSEDDDEGDEVYPINLSQIVLVGPLNAAGAPLFTTTYEIAVSSLGPQAKLNLLLRALERTQLTPELREAYEAVKGQP